MRLKITFEKELSIEFEKSEHSYLFEEEEFCVILTGRIYNEEISNKNPACFFFKSLKNGRSVISEIIDGYYAVLVINKKDQNIMVFRDPIGMQPLFYIQSENSISFSSSFEKIAKTVPELTISEEFMLLYLEDLVPETYELTIYDQIKRIKPNSYTKFNQVKIIEEEKLFDFDSIKTINRTDQQALEEFRFHLERAVSKNIDGFSKIGMQYTGGLDSTGILAIIKYVRNGLNGVETYIHEYFPDHEVFDEMHIVKKLNITEDLPLPKLVSEQFPIYSEEELNWCKKHHTLNIINQVFENILEDCSSKKINILLSGFGGDECITFNQNPIFMSTLVGKLKFFTLYKEIKVYGLKRFLSFYIKVFLKKKLIGIYKRGKVFDGKFRFRTRKELVDRGRISTTQNYISFMLQKSRVAYRIEEEKERAAAFGITLEYPWLDFRLIKFFLSLNKNQIIFNKTGRLFYKNALKKYIKSEWYFKYGKRDSVTVGDLHFSSQLELNNEILKEYENLPGFVRNHNFIDEALLLPPSIKELLLDRLKKINVFTK